MKAKFYNPISLGPSARIQKMAADASIRGQNQPPDTFPANISTAFEKYGGLCLKERQAKSWTCAIENMPVYVLPDSDLVGMRYHLGSKPKITNPMDWQAPAGAVLGATADGRFAGRPIAHGITPVNEMIKARENPEEFANLIVGVGGFSAVFINLSPDIQKEIISRSRHGAA